jgi:hypothetical protein
MFGPKLSGLAEGPENRRTTVFRLQLVEQGTNHFYSIRQETLLALTVSSATIKSPLRNDFPFNIFRSNTGEKDFIRLYLA